MAPPPDQLKSAGPEPAYDRFASRYAQLVASGYPVLEIAHAFVLESVGELAGRRLLDLGCGTGELTGRLAQRGGQVTGVDQSPAMLRIAARANRLGISFLEADIQSLAQLPDRSWDLAVASLCLMDLPEPGAVFAAAARALVSGGKMIWTIIHPCFGSPHAEPYPDQDGVLRERLVREYAPTWWQSPRPGTIRGEVGAFHRPLSDYLNSFIHAGFRIDLVAEPLVSPNARLAPDQESHRWLPPIVGVVGTSSGS
ncbi:MAG: methyltransferase domain-containing protein [Candidatus Dormiibacterota bacterium]